MSGSHRALPLGYGGQLVRLAVILLIAGVSALPILRLVAEPFLGEGSGMLAELRRPAVLRAIGNTIETGLAASLISLVLGTLCAGLLVLTDMRGKRVFAFLFTMSMLVAPQVVALAFKSLAAPASPLLGVLGLSPAPGVPNPMLGRGGIVLTLGLHHAPLAMLIVIGGLRRIPGHLVEAAALDGATPAQLSGDVLLPLLRGHLVAAWLLSFVAAAGNFGIPALLGLPANYLTIPTLIYRRMTSFGPDAIGDAAILSIVLGLITVLMMILAARLTGRGDATLDHGKPIAPFWRLGRLRPLAEGLAILLIGAACVLPLFSLLAHALVPALGVKLSFATLTLQPFAEVLLRQQVTLAAFLNSFLFAGFAALLVGLAAVPAAYLLERGRMPVAGAFRLAIDLPYALPGIVVAIAMILLFLKPLPLLGVSLYGTAAIIVLAYVARFLPLGVKPVGAAIRQFDPAIEEAGAMDGAGFLTRLRTLIAPPLRPAITAGMLLVFLTAFNELTVSALLWSAGTRTLGVVLFSLDEAGLANEAAALGITTVAIVALLMLVIEAMRGRLPENAIPWSVGTADHR